MTRELRYWHSLLFAALCWMVSLPLSAEEQKSTTANKPKDRNAVVEKKDKDPSSRPAAGKANTQQDKRRQGKKAPASAAKKVPASTAKKVPASAAKKAPASTAKEVPASAAKKAPASTAKKQTPQASVARAKAAAKPTQRFVDRDGDGIQDGKEYRFRRKTGSRLKKRRAAKRRGATDEPHQRHVKSKGGKN